MSCYCHREAFDFQYNSPNFVRDTTFSHHYRMETDRFNFAFLVPRNIVSPTFTAEYAQAIAHHSVAYG